MTTLHYAHRKGYESFRKNEPYYYDERSGFYKIGRLIAANIRGAGLHIPEWVENDDVPENVKAAVELSELYIGPWWSVKRG